MLTSEQYQTEHSFFFTLTGLLWFDSSELITVSENQIHVFVKGFECANECSTVLQRTTHAVVDVIQHLSTFRNLRLQQIVKMDR